MHLAGGCFISYSVALEQGAFLLHIVLLDHSYFSSLTYCHSLCSLDEQTKIPGVLLLFSLQEKLEEAGFNTDEGAKATVQMSLPARTEASV